MRLAGQIRLGYFPARPGAIAALLKHLDRPADPAVTTLFDPCAGRGAALRQIADGLGVPAPKCWAVELDDDRARECREALPGGTVLGPCSFFATRISMRSFSLVYCNSPFDSSEASEARGRAEEAFLFRATHFVAPGGTMALVLPERTWLNCRDLREHFDLYYDDTEVFRFPKDDRPYNELAVLAKSRKSPRAPGAGRERRWAWKWPAWERDAVAKLPELGSVSDPRFVYAVPPAPGPRVFQQLDYTEPDLIAALNASPLAKRLEPPRPLPPPAPPLALGEGHVALLLTAGFLNGLVEPPGEPPHVVRGGSRKERFLRESSTEEKDDGAVVTKEVWSERPITVVRALWGDGSIKTFEN